MTIINSMIKGGSAPVISELNVTPTTSAQQITAPQGTDGYSPVNVSAVTSSIDSNIAAGNIKDGVTILGVTGDYKGTTPSGTKQITSNGTHDVAGYANADVQVPTTAPDHYIELSVSSNIITGKSANNINLSNIDGISGGFDYLFYNDTTLTTLPDFSNITKGVILPYSFYGCSNATGNIVFQTQTTGLINLNRAFYGTKITSFKAPVASGTTVLYNNACFSEVCNGCTSLTSFIVPNGYFSYVNDQMFTRCCNNCTSLITVDLSLLKDSNFDGTLGGSMFNGSFYNCTSLQTIDLSFIKICSVYAGMQSILQNCTSLTYADLRNFESVSQNNNISLFYGCTSLRKQKFESLKSVTTNLGNWFAKCQNLHIYFYALTTPNSSNYWTSLLGTGNGAATDCTIHFPINMSSTMGTWNFGGTNTTVLFDIVTSITGADTNVYTRQEKDSTSTATAWNLNNTLYYTSGTTEPTVGDTIYSDSACTTAVTTISSIA